MPDISCRIKGLEINPCIFNAAGVNDETLLQLKKIAASRTGAIVMKSCTLEARAGNPEPRYRDVPLGSINSMGLPNLGYMAYGEFAIELKKKWSKPVVASVSGMSIEENMTIVNHFNKINGIDSIEFNPGSPNTIGRPIAGYDFEYVDQSLGKIKEICTKPLGIKLPPYFDFSQYEKIAQIINKHRPDYVVTINSIGNGLIIDYKKETTLIKPKGGFGGIGGEYIKPTALANVRKLYELLHKDIKIIGVGGVRTGVDAFEYMLCGAAGVQVGTTFMKDGPKCFARIEKELLSLMKKKWYKSIEDFRGKLKVAQ